MKFKVGDRVDVVNLELDEDAVALGLETGLVGTVSKVHEHSSRPIYVLLDGRDATCGFSEDELELEV